jgi:2-polyprenyl-6-methoxyphenol hydroxylase-like FAD-dependent oxidoreductase
MGGLTSALALAKKGFKHIDIYETASDLGFVGAGIQLAPNMARVLDKLGVWKAIEAEAVNIEETSVRGASPTSIFTSILEEMSIWSEIRFGVRANGSDSRRIKHRTRPRRSALY